MVNKPKNKVSNIMLVVICVMIICYAIANFVLQYFTQIEVSPTLTTAWFSFWGVELISLAAIKTSKIKHSQDNTNDVVEYEIEETTDVEVATDVEQTEEYEETVQVEKIEKVEEKYTDICLRIYYPGTKDKE